MHSQKLWGMDGIWVLIKSGFILTFMCPIYTFALKLIIFVSGSPTFRIQFFFHLWYLKCPEIDHNKKNCQRMLVCTCIKIKKKFQFQKKFSTNGLKISERDHFIESTRRYSYHLGYESIGIYLWALSTYDPWTFMPSIWALW